jgi:nitrogen fixation/metabolism regulation signal transduction histidine kinase
MSEQEEGDRTDVRLTTQIRRTAINVMPGIILCLLAAYCVTAGLDYYFDRTCSLAHYTGQNFAAAEMFGLATFAILMLFKPNQDVI